MTSFVNFQEHPTNRNIKVFHFSNTEYADYFEGLLVKENIEFERQVDEEGDQRIYYGIHLKHFNKAKELNYLTIGNFRQKFIPDVFFRYFVIVLSIILLGLAITGAIVSN